LGRSRWPRSPPGCWSCSGTRFGEELNVHGLLIGAAIALGVWFVAVFALVALGRLGAARELAGLVPNLLLLFKDLVGDERVPRSAKLWLGFAAVWLASPIDLIPEFVPVLGPLDDAVVAAAVLRHLVRKAGSEVVYEHWRGEPSTISRVLRLFGAEDAVR
jgi:uncharacterized membrane protein YkvA (DUF1232 family)